MKGEMVQIVLDPHEGEDIFYGGGVGVAHQDHPSRPQYPMDFSEESHGIGEVLDNIKGSDHVKFTLMERGLLPRLREDGEPPSLTTIVRPGRGNLQSHDLPSPGLHQGEKEAVPRPHIQKPPLRDSALDKIRPCSEDRLHHPPPCLDLFFLFREVGLIGL